MLAAEGNHQECVALLAVAGADLNAKYGLEELTALHRYMRETNHTVSYQKYWLLAVAVLLSLLQLQQYHSLYYYLFIQISCFRSL